MNHRLTASPETVHWGWFDAALPHVLTIESGDRVTIDSISGGPKNLPGEGFEILPEHLQIHARSQQRMPGHILTGPVGVRDAQPGDVLEVRVIDVQLRQDWGYTAVRPLAGALPDDIESPEQIHTRIDREAMVGTLPWGLKLPLRPFFGVMGVSPPRAWGAISTIEPRAHGGNIDLKHMVPGSTLYLPVFNEGAGFSVGDGHGVQGDGEVCVTALEMCLTGTFTFILHKGGGASRPLLKQPKAETPTHFISMGLNEDLDQAMKQALREMISFICSRSNLSREQAYQFCSLAVDFHVTQTVNGEKGIHGMLKKGLLF